MNLNEGWLPNNFKTTHLCAPAKSGTCKLSYVLLLAIHGRSILFGFDLETPGVESRRSAKLLMSSLELVNKFIIFTGNETVTYAKNLSTTKV